MTEHCKHDPDDIVEKAHRNQSNILVLFNVCLLISFISF